MSVVQGRLPVGHLVSGRYQVAALIGAGEMGEVYDVRDTSSGYAYALKLLHPDLLQKQEAFPALEREARKATELGLDIVAKAYEFGVEPQTRSPYVLGELVLLPSMRQMVSTQGPISISSLEVILRTLAAALDKAHQAGLIHRALKPTNIFASQTDAATWQVRVTDFGIASMRLVAPPPPGWTASPGWLSAEQADPSSTPSPSMDIYALGLVAFQALTGRSPYRSCQSDTPDLNLLWGEMTAPLPPASTRARELGATLSPTLDPWFARALSVSPSQRFKTVGEMAQALWGLVGSSQHIVTMRPPPGVAAVPPAPSPAPAPKQSSAIHGRQQTLMYGESMGMPPPPSLPAAPVQHVPRPGGSAAVALAPPAVPQFAPVATPDQDDDELPTRAMTREQFELGAVSAEDAVTDAVQFGAGPGQGPVGLPGMPPQAGMPIQGQDPGMQQGFPGQGYPAQGATVPHQLSVSTAQSVRPRKSNLLIPIAAGGGVLVVGLVVILIVAMLRGRERTGEPPEPTKTVAAASPSAPASAPASAAASATASGPAADAAAPASDALLKLTCDPECDEVKCDGKAITAAASGVRLEPGRHSCTGTKKGYVAKTETFELKAGDETSKTLALAKASGGSDTAPPSTGGGTTTAKPPTTASKPPAKPPGKTCGTFLNPCKK
ncbi:MAG: serine/threonine protein kinase [Deltaproteobacteria bacterium]|nr:serine/threonine protein kinase [Deltaproteobacteria bacterium]